MDGVMRAGYLTYDSYKDDVAPWLGKVPTDWRFEKAKWFLSYRKQLNSDGKIDNVLSLTLRGVVNNDPDNPEGLVPKDYRTYQFFEADDLVFKLIDLENVRTSRVGLVHEQGIMSSAYIRIVPPRRWNARFLHYYYFHLYEAEVFNKIGSGVRSTLGQSDLLELPIPVIDRDIQDKIVHLLDEKCSKVDEAVQIKQAQIALLRERRQILIQEAVTRGLNPAAPMKDSGIDWIGPIPAHWEVKPLRRISKIHSGNGFPIELQGDERGTVPFMKVSDFSSARMGISTANNMVSEGTIRRRGWNKVPPGVLVTAKIGEALRKNHRNIITVGAIIDNNCIAFEALDVDPIFFYWLHKVIDFEWFVNPGAVPSISVSKYKSEKVALPPFPEQRNIVEHIEQQSTMIDNAITIKESQIAALREYKTSLINEAVTGKIKVA